MIIGHNKQLQYLSSLANTGKIPHGLLFSGQKQLGKRTAALEFIKLLNCQNFQKNPKKPSRNFSGCQDCRSCQEIQKGIYPDLRVVSPESKEIQISQIRELGRFLSLRPFSGQFKAALIDGAQVMTREAQGCLLKTLEEPKGSAVLILITEHPASLLPTVLSRVEKVAFYSVATQEIEKGLCSQGADLAVAKEIALKSLGRPGRAIDFFHDSKKLEEHNQRAEEVAKMSDLDLVERFQYAKTLSQEPAQLKEILEVWLMHFRKILLQNLAKTSTVEDVFHAGESIPDSHVHHASVIKAIEKTLLLLSTTNVNPRLALEALMLQL